MTTAAVTNAEVNLELNIRRWTVGVIWVPGAPIAHRVSVYLPIVALNVMWFTKLARDEMDRTLAGRKSEPHGLPGRRRVRVPQSNTKEGR